MFDCSDDIIAYHNSKTTLPQAERNAMRERRDANRERLKSRLKEKGNPLPHEFIKQGSYAMLTMVQDIDNDYDIDDGVYFTQKSLRDKDGKDMDPEAVRKMVCDALQDDRFKQKPEVRKTCVRIFYDEGFHVDMPVYRICEADGEYELANGNSWVVSRAADVEDWFNDVNEERSPDNDNGRQFRRVTRLLKKFSRSRPEWKASIAPGFTITTLTADTYIADSDREDVALRSTMKAMFDRLNANLEVEHPVTPNTKITKGPNDSETAFLRDKLKKALENLEVLDDSGCARKTALAAWDKVFNTDFFSSRSDTKSASAVAYGAGPTIITNPPRPWTDR